MSRIVHKHFPTERLPPELREGFEGVPFVDVTVEAESAVEVSDKKPPTLEALFARRRPPFRTPEEIDADLRRQRDEWE